MKSVMHVLYFGKINEDNPFAQKDLRENYVGYRLLDQELCASGIHMFFASNVFEVRKCFDQTMFSLLIYNMTDAEEEYIGYLRELRGENEEIQIVLLRKKIREEDIRLADELDCICILELSTMNKDSFFYLLRSLISKVKKDQAEELERVYADVEFLHATYFRNAVLTERWFDDEEQIKKGRELGLDIALEDLYVVVLFQLAKSKRVLEEMQELPAIEIFHMLEEHLITTEKYNVIAEGADRFVLLFHQKNTSYEEICSQVEGFVDKCCQLDVRWRGYVGARCRLASVRDEYLSLKEMEEKNVLPENCYLFWPGMVIEKGISVIEGREWIRNFVEDKAYRIKNEIELFLGNRIERREINILVMQSLVHRLTMAFYASMENRSHPLEPILANEEYLKKQSEATKSLEAMWEYFAFLEKYNSNLIQELKKKNFLSTKIIQYVKENIENELSRENIADQFAMSKDYVSHIFKEEYGISLISYINQEKINRAREYLIKGELSVGEISTRLGIDNFSYFTRIFKKEVGVSPQNYRQNYLKKRVEEEKS